MFNLNNAQAALQQAQALAQAGRHGEAWTIIAPLRQALDGHGQALRLYALIAQGAGRLDECVEALRRIIQLEHSPPDIIGALADTLGQAGRHDEAYREWTRLVGLQPNAADAHLNRAISAISADRPDDAVDASEEALKRYPTHARLLAIRALALHKCGRIADAIEAFERAVAVDPTRAVTRFNQGVCLNAAHRYDEACAAFKEAQRLGAKGAQLEASWGAALLNTGRIDEAEKRYRRALAAQPDHDEAKRALTVIGIEHRGGDGAFDHYRAPAEAGGGVEAWSNWVFALINNQRQAEAAEVGRRGLATIGDHPQLAAPTYFAEGIAGDAARALAAFDRLPQAARDDTASLLARAQLALKAGEPDRAAALALRFQEARPTMQNGWAILGVAWRLLDDPREEWLCDYDRLVMVTDVPSPEADLEAKDYAREVAQLLEPLHVAKDAPGDQSLRNGTQTQGSLFARLDPGIQRFRRAVELAAARKIAELPDDPDHPFLSRKSTDFGFSGSWSVRLRGGGGHHVPHFHGDGWMSSAYYAHLPDTMGGEEQAGWIEFGRPPAMYGLDLDARHVVEPQVGRLVLFPSYLWHGTIPLSDDGGFRLTAAFDYQPK